MPEAESVNEAFAKKDVFLGERACLYDGTTGLFNKIYKKRLIDISHTLSPDATIHAVRILKPQFPMMQAFDVHLEFMPPLEKSENHGHMNGALIYILEGRGHEVHNGKTIPWKAGDFVTLPPATQHQHFNDDPNVAAAFLAIKQKPLYFLYDTMWQKNTEIPYRTREVKVVQEDERSTLVDEEEPLNLPARESKTFSERKNAFVGNKRASYYENALKTSQMERRRREPLAHVIRAEDMPWELCSQGILKHVINEEMGLAEPTHDAYMQMILPGSRSGKHRHISAEFFYVLEGSGYDLHWDPIPVVKKDDFVWTWQEKPRKIPWSKNCIVVVPPWAIHQHLAESRARLLSVMSRVPRAMGMSWFDQVESAPEYSSGKSLDRLIGAVTA